MLHRALVLISILAVAVGAACRPAATAPAVDVSHVPLRAPDGVATDLAHVANGRVAIVSLWAPWCEACRTEAPALERLGALARERGDFVLVSIAIDTSEGELGAKTASYPRLVDTGPFAELGAKRVPATLVLGRDGRTVFEGGALDEAALEALKAALAE